LARLDELEAISGISPVIVHERLIYRTRLGRPINDAEQQSAEPTTAAEFHQLGRAMFHEGEFEKAARLFDRGLREDPAALFMNFDRAQCAMALGRHDDAIQSFTACVALNPGPVIFARRAEALAARATSHERRIAGSIAGWCEVLADRAAARADYLAALRRSDNKLAEAWFGLGLLDARQRKFGAAEQNFVKALQTGHPEAPVRVNLAIVQAETGRLSAAIGNARRAVALRPNDAEAKALLDKLEKESIPNRRPLTGTISAIKQWETIQ